MFVALGSCPVCGENNWINYGDYVECGNCGHDLEDTDDVERESSLDDDEDSFETCKQSDFVEEEADMDYACTMCEDDIEVGDASYRHTELDYVICHDCYVKLLAD